MEKVEKISPIFGVTLKDKYREKYQRNIKYKRQQTKKRKIRLYEREAYLGNNIDTYC